MYYIFYDMSNNKTKARTIAPSFLYDLEYLQAEMAPKNSWRPLVVRIRTELLEMAR